MQKISSSLFNANKFLPPNSAKTWNFLLGKKATQHETIDETPADLAQDVESFLRPGDDEDIDPNVKTRKVLRSGRMYLTIPRATPRSILKPAHLVPSCVNSSEAF